MNGIGGVVSLCRGYADLFTSASKNDVVEAAQEFGVLELLKKLCSHCLLRIACSHCLLALLARIRGPRIACVASSPC